MNPRAQAFTLGAVFTAGMLTGLRLHDLRERRVHRALEEDRRHTADDAHFAAIEDITARDPSPRHPAQRGLKGRRLASVPRHGNGGDAA